MTDNHPALLPRAEDVEHQLAPANDGPAVGDERFRLRALARYAILDTPPDQGFDDLSELARLVAATPVSGIGFFDRDRVWFKSLLGAGPDDYTAAQLRAAQHRTVAETAAAIDDQQGPDPGLQSFPCVTSDGVQLGCLFVAQDAPLVLEEATVTALVALARQVVQLLELRRTSLAYQTIVDGAGAVVFHLDDDDNLVSLTPTWSQMSGFGVVRSIGARLQDFLRPEDRDAFARWLGEIRSASVPPVGRYRLVRLTGDEVMVEVLARPLADERGQPIGVVGVLIDVTERHAQELEAQNHQRLQALGRLSAGLAHEINTPIQFVGDNTRFLAECYEALLALLVGYRDILTTAPEAMSWAERNARMERAEADAEIDYLTQEVPSAIQQSLDGVERVASLVRAMKSFSHPGTGAPSPADLNDALEATITVARNQFRDVADAQLDLGELPRVTCHVADLNQAFLNLVVNAADAIEETGKRGTITVRTRQDVNDALITISDTGAGVPDDLRSQIFEPFFTTKEVGRGTGQGLALVKAIVDRHRGRVSVDSEPGRGSTFTIRIPIDGDPEGEGGAS